MLAKKFRNIRLLETGHNSAVYNMAVDEALMWELSASSNNHQNKVLYKERGVEEARRRKPSSAASAVLRIYGWKPRAVSIGYFQSMDLEVDVRECKKRGIDVIRRITGGGTVYHDAELTYSFLTSTFPNDIMQSYMLICNPVVQAIRYLGFDARFVPLNDIVIGNGAKVSGNAQTRRKDVLLQHGTILLEVDIETMFSILKIPSEKIKDKLIDDVKKRVNGIHRSFDEVALALKMSFSEAFDTELRSDMLTADECSKVDTLIREKYSSDSWNRRR